MKKNSAAINTIALQQMDKQHFLHPFTDSKNLAQAGTRVIDRAEGVYLWDSDGNKILDGMSGLWCTNLGYSRQELVEAAYVQLQKLPFYNSFFQCSHPPAIELAQLLAEVTPEGMQHVFYTNSGSEANDTVIRMVRTYWDLLGKAEKNILISRDNAYHGSTMGGASLGGMKFMHAQGGLPIPNIHHIMQPHYYALGDGETEAEFGLCAAKALENKILELGQDRVGAFVAEPIQGAGGVIVPPDSYWPEIQRICKQYEVLLVADEVICGFGRTGHWFASDYYGLKPDLMPIAKGLSSGYLPIGGVMVRDKIAQVIIEQCGELAHGFTYSGHPVACAVAIANIKILQQETWIEKIHEDIGPYFQAGLRNMFSGHPMVADVQGVGLVAGLQLSSNRTEKTGFKPAGSAGNLCRDFCVANGLVMRAVGDRMILAPPFIITHDQIDELLGKAKLSIDQAAQQLCIT